MSKTAGEFENIDYEVDKDGNPKNRLQGTDNHSIDMTRYACEDDMGKRKVVMGGKVKECSRTFIVRLFLCSLLIEERRTYKGYERQENHKECKSI